jgi:hypothetical protein
MAGDVRLAGHDDHGRLRIAVTGRVDAVTGGVLASLCGEALGRAPAGLALDLTAVSGATRDGVVAIARCLAVGRRLRGGVDVAVATSAGQRLLLAILAEV